MSPARRAFSEPPADRDQDIPKPGRFAVPARWWRNAVPLLSPPPARIFSRLDRCVIARQRCRAKPYSVESEMFPCCLDVRHHPRGRPGRRAAPQSRPSRCDREHPGARPAVPVGRQDCGREPLGGPALAPVRGRHDHRRAARQESGKARGRKPNPPERPPLRSRAAGGDRRPGRAIEITLPDGSVYQTLITSIPIIHDGKVVAALSVWHDFDAYTRLLVEPGPPPETRPSSPDA